MLSVLFAPEACYTIKENNNNNNNDNIKKLFCQGKLAFYRRKLSFFWPKLRKAYFVSVFFCRRKLPFCRRILRKAYFPLLDES